MDYYLVLPNYTPTWLTGQFYGCVCAYSPEEAVQTVINDSSGEYKEGTNQRTIRARKAILRELKYSVFRLKDGFKIAEDFKEITFT